MPTLMYNDHNARKEQRIYMTYSMHFQEQTEWDLTTWLFGFDYMDW